MEIDLELSQDSLNLKFIEARTNRAVRNELVLQNQNLIFEVMKSFKNHESLSKEDLFHEGILALIDAIERFDPSKGFTFSTYAYPTIKGRLKTFITDNFRMISIPRHVVHQELKRAKQIREHSQQHDLSLADSAKQLGLSEASSIPSEASTSSPINSNASTEVGSLITESSNPSPEVLVLTSLEYEDLNRIIAKVTNHLSDEIEKRIFYARYGNLEEPSKPIGYGEIATRLGIISADKINTSLKKFWARVRSDRTFDFPRDEIDESWFYSVLKQRETLRDHST